MVTVAGWFVVASQHDKREFRKEVREHLKELREKINDVRKAAEAYWLPLDAKSANQAAITLKAELQRLGRLAGTFERLGLDLNATPLLVAIRQHATGGDFEKRRRRKNQTADSDRLTDIIGTLDDLLTAAEDSFYRRFKPVRSRPGWQKIPLGILLLVGSDGSNHGHTSES